MNIKAGVFVGKSFDSDEELISFGNEYNLLTSEDLEKISHIDELGCFNLNKFEHISVAKTIECLEADTHHVVGVFVMMPSRGCAIKDAVDDMYWSAQYWSHSLNDVFFEDIQTIVCNFKMNEGEQ